MKKFLIAFLLLLLTIHAFAANTILIVGDSLSAGLGISLKQAWPSLLQERLKTKKIDYQVINDSISGDTTSNGLARFSASLKEYQPKITIIELGANDGLRGLNIDIIKSNLQAMIHQAKKADSKVLILGLRLPPNYGPVYTQAFQNMFLDLAKTNHVSVVANFLKNVDDNDKLIQPDRLHPTAEAQPVILDNVWPTLAKMNAW